MIQMQKKRFFLTSSLIWEGQIHQIQFTKMACYATKKRKIGNS